MSSERFPTMDRLRRARRKLYVRQPVWRALLLLLVLGGCTTVDPAYPVVPQPLAERVPAPPRSAEPLSWRPGYCDWVNDEYLWTPGDWVPLAGHGTLWQDGYWRRTGFRTYQWVRPGWR